MEKFGKGLDEFIEKMIGQESEKDLTKLTEYNDNKVFLKTPTFDFC